MKMKLKNLMKSEKKTDEFNNFSINSKKDNKSTQSSNFKLLEKRVNSDTTSKR